MMFKSRTTTILVSMLTEVIVISLEIQLQMLSLHTEAVYDLSLDEHSRSNICNEIFKMTSICQFVDSKSSQSTLWAAKQTITIFSLYLSQNKKIRQRQNSNVTVPIIPYITVNNADKAEEVFRVLLPTPYIQKCHRNLKRNLESEVQVLFPSLN